MLREKLVCVATVRKMLREKRWCCHGVKDVERKAGMPYYYS